jgi:hypothetical protein
MYIATPLPAVPSLALLLMTAVPVAAQARVMAPSIIGASGELVQCTRSSLTWSVGQVLRGGAPRTKTNEQPLDAMESTSRQRQRAHSRPRRRLFSRP